ncbi:hypothetical protein CONLIGDRAFT_61996 [Coniochaeta ligniaria NRRL 30616]|uniref:Uncharacterized protein n=1 Tax=Coniochaeta ligniaria NRRL 30616 TaxID=1408157 RepID=A0A1J7J6U9_9PEZI|nr:hypothetical protein CONLIGDRAFT_61996 [Coniochaeta ligniaria NRRL 30616]
MATTSSLSMPPRSPLLKSTEEDVDPRPLPFSTIQNLLSAIKSTTSDFLAVKNVAPSDFAAIERTRDHRQHGFRLRRYNSGSGILVITIPTRVHESLHTGIYRRLLFQLYAAGVHDDWKDFGAATFRQQNHPGGDGGEGDSAGGPIPARASPGQWPTLVIEAGDSESLAELHRDMEWWFETSDHDVKIVILAKFDHRRQNIIIERWQEEIPSLSQGPVTRLRAGMVQNNILTPELQQTIMISQDATNNPPTYDVTRGPLVLGFELLFLRNPLPHEGDFVISIQELQRYAARVFEDL